MNLKELKQHMISQITDIDDFEYLNAIKTILDVKKDLENNSIPKVKNPKLQSKKGPEKSNPTNTGSENGDLLKWIDDRD
jgi:hypothetical protein